MIGFTVLTVALGIANGLDNTMIRNILSMTAHIKLTNSTTSIENYDKIKEEIKKIDGVKSATPKYLTQGIIKYNGKLGTFVGGVIIEGMPEKDAIEAYSLDKKLVLGKTELDSPDTILIGKEMSKRIGAGIGERIKVISSENKEIELTIKGIFQSGFYDYDSSMIIIPLVTAQMISDSEDIVTNIDVRIFDVYKASEIGRILEEKTQLNATTWAEQNKNLLTALSLEKTVMLIVLFLIIVISGFLVGIILNMHVKEKTKDIGILKAIGFGRAVIMKIFLLEGIVLGVAGIFAGVMFSIIIIFMLKNRMIPLPLDAYYLDGLPVDINVVDFLIIIAATMAVTFLASIFPANKASKLTPVEAMRYE
jgi:lipoprotein-releasing system permease protein